MDREIGGPGVESGAARPPESVGVDSTRLARALRIVDEWVDRGEVPGAAVVIVRRGVTLARHFRGSADPEPLGAGGRPVDEQTLFPLFSVTRPISATAFMTLVEAGAVLLDDPVARFVPEFGKLGKEQVRVRHLLSHTSGLPDMPPNNEALRKAHSGLPAFVRSVCRQEPAFNPGTRVLFSGVAVLMLAEIVERVSGQTFARFLAERLLKPLGLSTAGLRPPSAVYPRIASSRLPEGRAATTWDLNSPYWRQLGAPWGGAFATADEVARFGQFFLSTLQGVSVARPDCEPILSPTTARLMVENHTRGIPGVSGAPEYWGFGWALRADQPGHWSGDLASPATFGHAGASGTMLWIDPVRDLVCVVLTNQLANWSIERRRFASFSNAVQAAVIAQ